MFCNICKSNFECEIYKHFITDNHLNFFNNEQQQLIKTLVDYLESSNIKGLEGIRIDSAGGTGKTFTVSSIIKYLPKLLNFIVNG